MFQIKEDVAKKMDEFVKEEYVPTENAAEITYFGCMDCSNSCAENCAKKCKKNSR